MKAPRKAGLTVSLAALFAAMPVMGQEPVLPGVAGRDAPAPPPGGIIDAERSYAIGLGVAAFRWDERAPYDDMALGSFTIERRLWSGIRGRAGLAAGMTDLAGSSAGEPVATDVYLVDLQILAGPDFGVFREIGVLPYGLVGVGSLVTNPSSDGGLDLPTRSQSQFTYGGGVMARVFARWEARAEVTRSNFRLADPFEGENVDTETIHNLRWEGRISWLF